MNFLHKVRIGPIEIPWIMLCSYIDQNYSVEYILEQGNSNEMVRDIAGCYAEPIKNVDMLFPPAFDES